MIGYLVSIPLNQADCVEGRVIDFIQETGVIIVKDDDGYIYHGHEYQCDILSIYREDNNNGPN